MKINWLFHWFLFEVVTIVIATIYLIVVPKSRWHRYSIPGYVIVWLGAAALAVVWLLTR